MSSAHTNTGAVGILGLQAGEDVNGLGVVPIESGGTSATSSRPRALLVPTRLG
jgi:hypothetical protein